VGSQCARVLNKDGYRLLFMLWLVREGCCSSREAADCLPLFCGSVLTGLAPDTRFSLCSCEGKLLKHLSRTQACRCMNGQSDSAPHFCDPAGVVGPALHLSAHRHRLAALQETLVPCIPKARRTLLAGKVVAKRGLLRTQTQDLLLPTVFLSIRSSLRLLSSHWTSLCGS
jgi:hypothetical protein